MPLQVLEVLAAAFCASSAPIALKCPAMLTATESSQAKLQRSYAHARALHKQHGKSYYFATQLLPRDLRQSTYALYAFFRVPDEIVDNSPNDTPAQREQTKERLNLWLDDWRTAYQSGSSNDPVLHVAAHTFARHKIPFELSEDFLRAMIQDLTQTRYDDYAALKDYMWGSASVVGLMMSHVIGFHDARALDYAPQLGYAMQLTNFLRDIDEDYQQRGRIYFPLDELARFELSEDDIARRHFSPEFRAFMQFQAARAHDLYQDAALGIPMLNRRGRAGVATASSLYRAILDKLRDQDWNPFAGRASTSSLDKIRLTLRTLSPF